MCFFFKEKKNLDYCFLISFLKSIDSSDSVLVSLSTLKNNGKYFNEQKFDKFRGNNLNLCKFKQGYINGRSDRK